MPIRDYMHLFTPNAGYDKTYAYVIGVTKEQEDKLVENGKLSITKGDKVFEVNLDHCFCYGNIDFTTNSDDLNEIDESGMFEKYDIKFVLHSNYDYATHTCKTPYKYVMWYDSWDIKKILQYIHGCLNKPERVLIFKNTTAETKRIFTTNKHIRSINPEIIKKRKAMKAAESKEKQRIRINRLVLKVKK